MMLVVLAVTPLRFSCYPDPYSVQTDFVYLSLIAFMGVRLLSAPTPFN
jgi:hypothetical protein